MLLPCSLREPLPLLQPSLSLLSPVPRLPSNSPPTRPVAALSSTCPPPRFSDADLSFDALRSGTTGSMQRGSTRPRASFPLKTGAPPKRPTAATPAARPMTSETLTGSAQSTVARGLASPSFCSSGARSPPRSASTSASSAGSTTAPHPPGPPLSALRWGLSPRRPRRGPSQYPRLCPRRCRFTRRWLWQPAPRSHTLPSRGCRKLVTEAEHPMGEEKAWRV